MSVQPRRMSAVGRLVSRHNEQMKPVALWQASYLLGRGDWLSIAEESSHMHEALSYEQQTIGIIGGLLFTVAVTLGFTISPATYDQSPTFGSHSLAVYDAVMALTFCADVVTLLAVLTSVFTVLFFNVVEEQSETRLFVSLVGPSRLRASMWFLLIGSLFLACGLILHFIALCRIPAVGFAVLGFVVVGFVGPVHICVWWYQTLIECTCPCPYLARLRPVCMSNLPMCRPMLTSLYRVKMTTHTHPPITLSVDELDEHVRELCESVGGVHYLTRRLRAALSGRSTSLTPPRSSLIASSSRLRMRTLTRHLPARRGFGSGASMRRARAASSSTVCRPTEIG